MDPGSETHPYYSRYDDHYSALYAQGIRYWSDGPEEVMGKVVERMVSRIREAVPDPRGARLIELGCGEGFLMARLLELGVVYTGIDYSPHAIARAKERAGEDGLKVDLRVMDALTPDEEILRDGYDIVLDMACFHMFVVDRDRKRYLDTVRRLMGPEAVVVVLNQSRDEEAYEGEVRSIEEFERMFQVDLSEPHSWEAWNGEKWVPVELPSFAGRPKRREGYIREFRDAGFEVERVYEVGSKRNTLDFILRYD